MPFTPKETTLNISNPDSKLPTETTDMGFVDVIGDAFHIDNAVVALFKDRDNRRDVNSEYNPIDKLKEDEIPAELWDSFLFTDNDKEYDETLKSVQQDLEARDRLGQAGFSGLLASTAAALVDPTILIGGGTLVSALKAGKTAWKTGAITGSVVGSTVFAEEKLLQSTQAGRTDDEVFLNTAAGFTLSALLGAGAVKLSNRAMAKAANNTKQKLAVDSAIEKVPESLTEFAEFDKSIGAAQSNQQSIFDSLGLKALDKEQLGIAKSKNKMVQPVLDGYTKLNKLWNPAVRMMSSSSKRARQFYLELTDTSIKPQLVKEGFELSEPLESTLKRRYSDYTQEVQKFGDSFKEYKKSGGNLRWGDFREEVGKAFHKTKPHPDPTIAKTVKQFQKYYNDIGQEMIDLKMLPEDILTAQDAGKYLNRVYKTQKIQSNIPAFKNAITPYMRRQLTKIKNRLGGLVDDVDETGNPTKEALDAREQMRKFFDDDEFEDYLSDSVNSITNNLLKNNDLGGFRPPVAGAKGPLKKRAFNIPDSEIEEFLDNDILFLSDRYTRQVVPEIEIRNKFGDEGIDPIIEEVQKEYDVLQKNTSANKAKKLDKERKEVIKDLETTHDLLRGTYKGFGGDPDSFLRRASNSVLTLNYLTSLGGVAISSIPDIAMGPLRRGFGNFFGKSLKPFTEDLIKTGGKLSRNEARSYGQAMEVIASSRTQSLYNIGDPMAFGSPFERFLGNIGNKMSNINLINYWNDTFQQVAAIGTRFRIVNNIDDFVKKGRITAKEEEFMNFLGIGKRDRLSMQKQITEHGEEINGNLIPNIDKWTDPKLRNTFKSAIGKEVDRTVITKGATDIPRFGNTELGRMIFQWQNFNFAFNNKVLINGLQEADGRVLAGLGSLVSMGMVTESLKNKLSGREQPDSTTQWIDAGLDRSGVLGLLAYGNSFANIAGLDYRQLIGEDKRRPKNPVETFLGPSGKTFSKAGHLLGSISKEGFTQKDLHRLRTLTPGQNVFYLKGLFDKLEKEAGQNLPEKR